jgi:hypothetical protein
MWPLPGLRCEAGWLKSQLIAAFVAQVSMGKLPRSADNGERGNLMLYDRPMRRPANRCLRPDAQDDSR